MYKRQTIGPRGIVSIEELSLYSMSLHLEYKFLCDVPLEIINEFKTNLPSNHYKRAVFTSEENQRTLKAVNFLKDGDVVQLGNLLYSSHKGLRDLYEVSCDELDFLVDLTKPFEKILGARMMGGGFGGCTINLV